MKKSVKMLKSVPSAEDIKKILNIYSNSKWLKKGPEWETWLSDPNGWDSTIQLILFLDPVLNRKVGCWFYTSTDIYGEPNYLSWEDPAYEPDDIDQYNEISDEELDKLIGRSRKLKRIITILNEK